MPIFPKWTRTAACAVFSMSVLTCAATEHIVSKKKIPKVSVSTLDQEYEFPSLQEEDVFPEKFADGAKRAPQEKRPISKRSYRPKSHDELSIRFGIPSPGCLYAMHDGNEKERVLRQVACIRRNYGGAIDDAVRLHNVLPRPIVEAVIYQESRGRPDTVSPIGARGIMQFMDPLAHQYGVKNPFDPYESIPKGTQVLADYVRHFGSIDWALVAYNRGPAAAGRMIDAGREAGTIKYVREVRRVARLLASADRG
jgi:hypothetical protein